jgi:hypothetical protein
MQLPQTIVVYSSSAVYGHFYLGHSHGRKKEQIISHHRGDRAVKHPNEIAAKFRDGARDSEARNKEFAHRDGNSNMFIFLEFTTSS